MKAKILIVDKQAEARVDDGEFAKYDGVIEFDGNRVEFKEAERAVLSMEHKRAHVFVDGNDIGKFRDSVEFSGKVLEVTELEYHTDSVVAGEKDLRSGKKDDTIEVRVEPKRPDQAEMERIRNAERERRMKEKAEAEAKAKAEAEARAAAQEAERVKAEEEAKRKADAETKAAEEGSKPANEGRPLEFKVQDPKANQKDVKK